EPLALSLNVETETEEAFWAAIASAGPRLRTFLGSESSDSDIEVLEEHARRRSFIARFSYAVPTPCAVRALADFFGSQQVMEVCAGLGLWARLLRRWGTSIVATDLAPNTGGSFVAVGSFDAEAAVQANAESTGLLL